MSKKVVEVPSEEPQLPPSVDAAALIRALLPSRLGDDIVAGLVRLRFDDQTFLLPVLKIGESDTWKERCNLAIASILVAMEQPNANAETVLAFLMSQTPMQLDLLYAYDSSGALPTRDWIAEHATDAQLLTALLGVMAATFPLVAVAIAVLRVNADLPSVMRAIFSASTSSALPPTAGPLPTSGAN